MNTIILGAGASKSYNGSITKVKMPIAKDFFATFNKLEISKNLWVLVGNIINYLHEHHNISSEGFINYNEDIEVLHSEVREKLNSILATKNNILEEASGFVLFKTYMELIFLFTSVINEIQNGEISIPHLKLAKYLQKKDNIITFNWDTLMDRALKKTTHWTTNNGYFLKPTSIYRNQWQAPIINNDIEYPTLIKLHGSTNWLTGHIQPENGQLISMQEIPMDNLFIYESTIGSYNTYKGRYMKGYTDFSYGYYPPNLPLNGKPLSQDYAYIKTTISPQLIKNGTSEDIGLPSMPLIIPPIKKKNYSAFGKIFPTLWNKATESLAEADRIIIIGYSFPLTDTQSNELFCKAFLKRTTIPKIVILDPNPEGIIYKFTNEFGIPQSKIKLFKNYFSNSFNISELFD